MALITWLFQRITGVVLFLGLLIHFFVMHYTGEHQLSYEVVKERLGSPLWKTFDLAFLVSVLYHGFNGLWGIVTEYTKRGVFRRLLYTVILVSVSLLLVTGIKIILL
ncbi:MAG: succinate dehydrogenase, hydrophobic membrane anchor protein [Nitrospirae bacterium]|nr:MAG: succinate dehydrogenase, hydrophobic membrane anchor protein [Nitrospirota bacterium]